MENTLGRQESADRNSFNAILNQAAPPLQPSKSLQKQNTKKSLKNEDSAEILGAHAITGPEMDL